VVGLVAGNSHHVAVLAVTPQCKQQTSETTPIGGQVAAGLLYCTACRLELWDSDAVFITQNWDVG